MEFYQKLCQAITGGGYLDVEKLKEVATTWNLDADQIVRLAKEFNGKSEFNTLMYATISLAVDEAKKSLQSVLDDLGIDCDTSAIDAHIYVNYMDSGVDDDILADVLYDGKATILQALELAHREGCVQEYRVTTIDDIYVFIFKDEDGVWFGIEADGKCQHICELPSEAEVKIEKTQNLGSTEIRAGKFAYMIADDRIVLVEQMEDKTSKKTWECTRK